MKITRGSSRLVVIIGPLVFKVPRPLFFLSFTQVLKPLRRLRWKIARQGFRESLEMFKGVVEENRSERQTWRKTRASFLAPTYFGTALLVIQKFEAGEMATSEEVAEKLRLLPEDARRDIRRVNAHCFQFENFVKGVHGLRYIDYGNRTTQTGLNRGLTISEFIVRWQKELEKILQT